MTLKINVPRYGNIFAVADTFDELRTIPSARIQEGYSAIVAGSLSPADGLGGLFVWNSTSTDADNNQTIIAPDDGQPGRWRKIAVGQIGPVSTVPGPQGFKGDPGGNISAISLFVQAYGLAIPPGTNSVRTTGFSRLGVGAATYITDGTVNAAYVAANPLTSFISANGLGFRLATPGAVTPEMFGALGDGITNDTPAFRSLSAYVQNQGGGAIELAPGAKYIVGQQIALSSPQSGDIFATQYTVAPSRILWSAGGFNNTGPNLLPRGIQIYGNGATLKVAPGLKYGKFNTATSAPAADFSSGTNIETMIAYNAVIAVQWSTGPVHIQDVNIDGSCEDAAWGGRSGDYDWQIPGSGFYLQYNRQEMVENCTAYRCLLDGFQIMPTNQTLISNCKAIQNVRIGLNVRGGNGLTVINSRFADSGTSGHSTNPAAGMDLEQEDSAAIIERPTFIGCKFDGSFYQNIVAATGAIRGATFINSRFWAYSAYGAAINMSSNAIGFNFQNCVIGGSVQLVTSQYSGFHEFYKTTLTDRANYGPDGNGKTVYGANTGTSYYAATGGSGAGGRMFNHCLFDYLTAKLPDISPSIQLENCTLGGPATAQTLAGTLRNHNNIISLGVDIASSTGLIVEDSTNTLNGNPLPQTVGLRIAAHQAVLDPATATLTDVIAAINADHLARIAVGQEKAS